MTKDGEERFRAVVKMMIILQCSLEQMDEIKDVPNLYRQDIKKSINNLEKKLENYLRPLLDSIPTEQENIFMQTQRGVESIINKTIEEIHNQNIKGNE